MAWQKLVLEIMKPIKYIKQERGALVVLTAVLLPVLFGFMGIAYDVGNLYMHKARLQNVTDAAALAGGEVFKNHKNRKARYRRPRGHCRDNSLPPSLSLWARHRHYSCR